MSDSPRPTRADYQYAAEQFRDGLTSDAIETKLIDRGMAPDTAKEVVVDLMIQSLRVEAAQMLRDGMLPQQIEKQLRERGLNAESAKAVVASAHNMRADDGEYSEPAASGGGNPLLMVLGGIVFAIGVFLFIGNVSGMFPTVPCAGWLGMAIGGGIWGAGKKGG